MIAQTKREKVIAYLLTVDKATKQEILDNTGITYYYNTEKHLGEILSRLVNNGTLNRVKKGVYEINRNPNPPEVGKDQSIIDFQNIKE